jgi:hypothetical protein
MNLDFRCEKALEGAHAFAAAHCDGHRCGECQFAQLFALEDRAECVAAGNEHFGQMRLVTSPACRRFARRPGACVMMAKFGAASTQSQARQVARAS